MKTQLTIEESARLIELGVDAKLASGESLVGGALFTLVDLLSILPKEIDGYELNISANKTEYFVSYILWDDDEFYGTYIRDRFQNIQSSSPELIDALNKLAVWAIEQGHLKTEKK